MSIAPTTGALPLGTAQLHQQLADAVSMDPKLKGEIYSRIIEKTANQHNAFEKFTSEVDPRTNIAGGVRSIFARRNDLAAGNGSKVHFNVLGPPGGPGAKGAQTLTDRTSSVQMSTYSATVAFHRDAISFSKDLYQFLSAGRVLESTSLNMLGHKMGIEKQNHMAVRLIQSALYAYTDNNSVSVTPLNCYRPNNRTSRDAITSADVLSLADALAARARLSVMGGKPISQKVGATGYPIKGYLVFGTDMAFLPLRNDDSFMSVMSNGKANDAVTSGELFDWQGMPWYEMPSEDQKWDDYIGSPFLPKAKLGVAFDADMALGYGDHDAGVLQLIVNASNTNSQYFQFFPNAPYSFDGETATCPDQSGSYYAWIVKPNGGCGFVKYAKTFYNGANRIKVEAILSNAANTSTLGASTVGNVTVGSGASRASNGLITLGSGENIPAGFAIYDEFEAGSIIIPANANGVPIGYGFLFGSMSACFAHGRIEKAMIEQEEDFGFIKKRGYEMIFGTCVTRDPFSSPTGYLLLEHAVEHEGYPVPSIA